MSGPAAAAVAAGVLLDVGLKAAAPLGLGAVAACALRRRGSAAQRHAVWTAAFAMIPLLALAAALRGPDLAIDAPWLVAAWAVGAVASAVPIGRGLLALARLRRTALPDPHEPGLHHSDQVSMPITWGLLRPVVVLPTSARGWPRADRAAALAHERAHIARGDWAVHLAVWAVCALLWFHPLAWWARRALSREAEHAADDMVIAEGVRPSAYAGLLVALARSGSPRAALGVSASLVGLRVRAVLDARCRSRRRWPTWAAALAVGALLVPALGGWSLWAAPPPSCQPGLLP